MSSNQVDPGIKEDSLWSAKLIAGLGFGAARTVRPARSSSSSPGANPAVTRAFGRRWWVYDSATRGPARTRFIGERAASAPAGGGVVRHRRRTRRPGPPQPSRRAGGVDRRCQPGAWRAGCWLRDRHRCPAIPGGRVPGQWWVWEWSLASLLSHVSFAGVIAVCVGSVVTAGAGCRSGRRGGPGSRRW